MGCVQGLVPEVVVVEVTSSSPFSSLTYLSWTSVEEAPRSRKRPIMDLEPLAPSETLSADLMSLIFDILESRMTAPYSKHGLRQSHCRQTSPFQTARHMNAIATLSQLGNPFNCHGHSLDEFSWYLGVVPVHRNRVRIDRATTCENLESWDA